jgi:hypothetical protein
MATRPQGQNKAQAADCSRLRWRQVYDSGLLRLGRDAYHGRTNHLSLIFGDYKSQDLKRDLVLDPIKLYRIKV